MVEGILFNIGTEASCTDDVCGRITQVVVDPLRQTLTHLVIERNHHERFSRLVPMDLVEAGVDEVRLKCTIAEFEQLERAERTWFVPGGEGYLGYGQDQALLWPIVEGTATLPVTFDTLPLGEVAVRRGDHVHATDGQVGRVEALVVDRGTYKVSHVLLKEGHRWGRRDIAIPVAVVSAIGESGIRLSIRTKEVQDLPAIEFVRATT
jgi:sporulation protein YlmC with PRC-barrel domain